MPTYKTPHGMPGKLEVPAATSLQLYACKKMTSGKSRKGALQ